MKKLIAILVFTTTFHLSAQEAVPFTPFSGNFDKTRILADKADFKLYTKFDILREYEIIYKHSKDGLSDVIYYGDEYTKDITYYPNGKMKSYKFFYKYTPQDYNIEEYYTYDTQGRILKLETPFSMTDYYYTNTGIDSIVRKNYNKIQNKYLPAYKDIIQYTNSGYIHFMYQYIIEENKYTENPKQSESLLDQKGRVIKVTGETSADLEGEYTYSDDGYTYTSYEYNMPYCKVDYSFNKDGYLTKESCYFWREKDQYWSLDSTSEFNYSYSPTNNEQIKLSSCIVYTTSQIIVVETNNVTNGAIYSFSGALIKQLRLKPGTTQIPFNPGEYIVVLNGKSTKVKVN